MIYGDNPNRINEREDALGLKAYTYVPNISAIVQSGNLYVYCGSNPVYLTDDSGFVWESVFDVVSLCLSVVDVAANPYDPMNWVTLAGDVIDLVPFVTGVGEASRAVGATIKITRKADKATETIKVMKATDFDANTIKTIDNLPHKTVKNKYAEKNGFSATNNLTISDRKKGIAIHTEYRKNYKDLEGMHKEYKSKDGSSRFDFYNENDNIIYELKPFNLNNFRMGISQLRKYNSLVGGNNTLILEFY